MGLNVEEIKAALIFGGARPTLFEVTLSMPVAVNRGGDLSRFSFLCKATQIPPATIGTIPLYYKGRQIPLPGDREFQPWTVTVINDEDFSIRSALESWNSAINEHQGNIRSRGALGNPYTYRADASVIQLSKNGVPVRGYSINGMWPSEIAPIELSSEQTNTLEEFTATFSYDYWSSVDTDGPTTANFTTGLLR